MLASCHEAPGTFTQPHVGFPTAVLDECGGRCESQVHMSADFRGIARGPGAFDAPASGMGMARLGNRPGAALRPGGGFGGAQAQDLHPFSRGLKPWQGTHVRSQGDGHRAWHATPGLQSRAPRGQTPGLPVRVAFLLEPLAAFGMLLHRSDVFLQPDWVRGRGPAHFREPPQGGRAPMSPARVAPIVSEQKGVETALGVLEIPDGLCTRPGEVAHGCIVALGAIDRREIARAREARQLHRIPAVRCDPITRLFGQE